MNIVQFSRNSAPFEDSFWNQIDIRVVEIAKKRLTVRKLLEIEVPLNSDFIMASSDYKRETMQNGIELSIAQGKSLVYLYMKFILSISEIEYLTTTGIKTGLNSFVNSVNTITSQEDHFLLYGKQSAGIPGIMNIQGTHTISFPRWNSPGAATETILAGIELLDRAGIHGPYSLALDPSLYSQLYKIYPQSGLSEIENISALVTDGVVKCDSVESGGILIASGIEYASIVLGQDLITGCEGPSGLDYVFTLSEYLMLKINSPQAICILKTM